jgi:hypothetical protein
MAAITATPEKLDVGRVFQGTFGVISRNFTTFLVLSLLFGALPSVLTAVAGGGLPGQTFSSAWLGRLGIGWLVAVVSNSVLQGALVHATVSDLDGRRASVSECLRTGLNHFLPLILAGLLYGLLFAGGLVLFVVPGIIALVTWCVVSPVVVVERTGVLGAFGRARALTKGSRWRIFGLILIYAILVGGAQNALISTVGGPSAARLGAAISPGYVAMTVLVALINAMLGSAGVSVLYSELRRVRDGVGARDLAAVFD